MNGTKIIISPMSVITLISFLILTVLIYQIRDVILLLFASFIIASALYPIVDWMDKKMPRWLAVLIVYVVGIIIMATILIPFISVLIEQTREFFKLAPDYWKEVTNIIYSWKLNFRTFGFSPDLSRIFSVSTNLQQHIVSQSINFTIAFITGLIAAFTMSVMVLFLLLDKHELKAGFFSLFPKNLRKKAEEISVTISRKVGGYVRGELLLMFTTGLFTGLVMLLLKVKFALLLGLLAGIFEIIPIIGPILSSIPAILVTLAQNPSLALATIIAYIVIHRIENSVLAPLILGRFLEVHPLIIIVALLIAASTMGVAGIILAPPIAASVYVLVQELYIKKINQEGGNTT